MTRHLEILEIAKLKKNYEKSSFEIGPVNLTMGAGNTLGVLGKNGAGKTTLFQMITGNLMPSEGQIIVAGKKILPDNPEAKRGIGYLPQALDLPRWVTAFELLNYALQLYGLEKPKQKREDALDYWDCNSFAHKPIAACSHGMQKRVGLALCMIHEPALAILDEPFSGLDLYHIRALQQCIARRKKQGLLTILSTHIAPYAAELCDQVLMIENGHVSSHEKWTQLNEKQRVSAIEEFFFGEQKTE